MVITISNRYGCGAIAVAQLVASNLQYELVDEQLPVVVAKRLRTSPQVVESAEDTGTSISERMLRALETGTPEIGAPSTTFDEECLREVQDAVREYAAAGKAVIVGRGANAILGRGAGIVRVFMYAPRDWRMRHIMEAHSVDERTALAEIERVDRARAQYMHIYYGIDWGNPENYDLAFDTSRFGPQGCARMIELAAQG